MTPGPGQKGEWLLAWGRKVLAPDTFERTLGAAEADVRHELAAATDATEARRMARGARWMFVRVLVAAMAQDRAEARRGMRWWLLASPLLAVVVGAFGVALTEGGRVPLAQLVFLVVALGLGFTMASTPRRILTLEAPAAGWLAVSAMAAVAVIGVSHGGATRWLAVGPLMIQMTTLALPFVVLGLVGLLERGRDRHALLLGIAAQAAVVATADLVASLTFAAVAVVVGAVVGGRLRAWLPLAVVGSAGLALAAVLDPMLAPVAHSEGVLGLFAQVSPALTVLGVVALGAAIVAPLVLLARRPGVDAATRALALVLALSLALPALAATMVDTVVPLLGYSGSTVVAAYLGLGALMSYERRAGERVTSTC